MQARVFAVILSVAIVPPVVVCADQTPAPLPVIGRTRANTLCKTVREVVAPAVRDLMNVDRLLAQSRTVYAEMADHSRLRQNLDRVSLGKIVVGMARDLSAVQTLVDDPKRFPKSATTEEDRLALQLRQELRTVAERDSRALDIVNGVLETDLMAQMIGGLPRAPVYGGTGRFYSRVADAVAEHQTDIGHAEADLAAAVVAASTACGGDAAP